jgi:hypothetical protein
MSKALREIVQENVRCSNVHNAIGALKVNFLFRYVYGTLFEHRSDVRAVNVNRQILEVCITLDTKNIRVCHGRFT